MVPVEDEEISKELARVFRKRGIELLHWRGRTKVERTKTGVAVEVEVERQDAATRSR